MRDLKKVVTSEESRGVFLAMEGDIDKRPI